jgi:hypothetical protein
MSEKLALKEFPLEATVDIRFDASDVVATLMPLEVIELVIDLDRELNSWEGTLLCYHYFKQQYDLASEHRPLKATMTILELEDALEQRAAEESATKESGY